MDSAIQSTMALAQQSAPIQAPSPTGSRSAAIKSAKEFESVFISQFMGSMFSGIQSDENFGGGEGEDMFRSMMTEQYSQQIEKRGGFGLADAVTRQLLKTQEASP